MNIFSKYGKILASVAVAAAMLPVVTSCQKDYELELPLSVNQTSLSLGAGGGETVVMVYNTESWSASLDDEEDARWATIERGGAKGNGDFTFVYTPNPGVTRTAQVNIISGSDTIKMSMVQAGFVSRAEMTLKQATYEVAAAGGTCKVGFETNLELVPYLLKGKVVYDDATMDDEDEADVQGWVSNIIVEAEEVTFDVAPNITGAERRAKLSVVLKKNVGAPVVNEMEIIQKP